MPQPVRAITLCLLLAALLVPAASHASLVPTIANETTGTGLGAVNTVLTVQNDPTEAGCVAPDGMGGTDSTATACAPYPGISGSDATAQSFVRSLAEVGVTNAFNLRIVFNFNEDSADNITLENLILGIFSPDGTVLFTSEPFAPILFTEPFNGTGTSGFVFRLDTQQAAEAQQYFGNPNNLIGLAAELSQTSAGPETFYIGDATAVTPAEADLSITKIDFPDPVEVGSPLTYRLTVTNDGPNNAQNVTVSDTLPNSVTFQSATPDQGSCTTSGQVVLCDLGTLNSGATTEIDIIVVPNTAGSIVNSAAVSSDTPDPDPIDNSDSTTTTVEAGATAPSADLSLTKTDSVDPATLGVPFTYTLTVTNEGPDAATGVTLTDVVPDELAVGTVTPSQGSCTTTGQVVTCGLGSLAATASATVTIQVTPTTDDVTVTNSATVEADQPDPDGTDNGATETTDVGTGAGETPVDVSVTKNGPDTVIQGSTFDYNISVLSSGVATGVVVRDVLPAGLTFVSAMAGPGSCTADGQIVTCNVGLLTVDDVGIIALTVSADQVGTFTNNVTVTADQPDPNPANNQDTDTTTVVPQSADLSITKTDDVDPVMVGGTVTYTLTATNDGPGQATGVTVTDVLPASVTLQSATASQGSCMTAGQVVTCDLGTLAAMTSATVTIQVTADQAGQITDNASVSGNEPDPDDTDNTTSETTTVGTGTTLAADLRLVKTADPANLEVGDTVTFNIAVFNDGPDTATGVTVVDTLPANFVYDSAMASSGTCMVTGGSTVVCELGTLASGAMETVTITAVADAEGTTTNTATVSGDEVDPDPTDNTDTTTTVTGGGGVVGIPTLGEYALLMLALLLALGGVTLLRRV